LFLLSVTDEVSIAVCSCFVLNLRSILLLCLGYSSIHCCSPGKQCKTRTMHPRGQNTTCFPCGFSNSGHNTTGAILGWSNSVITWMGDHLGRSGAVNLGPFVGLIFVKGSSCLYDVTLCNILLVICTITNKKDTQFLVAYILVKTNTV